MESSYDYVDGFVPTLDTSVKMCNDGHVEYRFFKKPMAPKRVMMKQAALSEQTQFNSLSNDLIRRLMSTSLPSEMRSVTQTVRNEIVNDFAGEIMRSGYGLTRTREIIKSGLVGYKRIARKELENSRGILRHRILKLSELSRKVKKISSKGNWFRRNRRDEKDQGKKDNLTVVEEVDRKLDTNTHMKDVRLGVI